MKSRKKLNRIVAAVLILFISTALCFYALGAEDDFEGEIALFPESYKPYLRALHEKYPEWVFEPFVTGLDWGTVIDNELGAKSLVEHSAASENLKSKKKGDYDAANDKYIYKDGGFVTANRLCVEYFIDPRNFLTEEGIFQFEKLSFAESFEVSDVEAVLKGSFMADSYITYYDAEGALIETEDKYAEVIYLAGKTYNVNPCYLASKIRNEVGASGSGSVSGTHSVYPGIYNFYNIGATDGTGAITRGLQWANGGADGTATSYGRPWNTPRKSIMGGAEYIAKSYIAVGQFTGYLQRFNVNPDGDKALFTHQYMTNISGACSQGYTNYTAYAKTGKLYQKNIFSIPVYENMPSQNIEGELMSNVDSASQTAEKTSGSTCYVRSGPSTTNAKLTDISGKDLKLSAGDAVTVLGKTFTDSDYYINILKYPHWVRVSFVSGGKTYEGYIPEDFVTYTSATYVSKGEYNITHHKGDNTTPGIIISDESIAQVTADGKVNFLGKGTVYLTSFDSVGRYDIVKYVVSNSATAVPSVKVTAYTETLKMTVSSDESFGKYAYTVSDAKGNIVKTVETEKTTYTLKGLGSGEKYTISVKGINSNKHSASEGAVSVLKPYQVTGVTMTYTDEGAYIKWNQVKNCVGYLAYGYNSADDTYTKIAQVTSDEKGCAVSADKLIYDSYRVRAYCKNGTKSVYGEYSDFITPTSRLSAPDKPDVTAITTSGYTLSWDEVPGAKSYTVYIMKGGAWQELANVSETKYKVNSLKPGAENAYCVTAVNGSDSSKKSQEVYAITAPEKVVNFKAEDVTSSNISLRWDKADGADKYNIYIYENGEFILYDEYNSLSCNFKNLSQFTEYKFKVTAVAVGEKVSLAGAMSEEITVVTLPETVSGLAAVSIKDESVLLSWNANEKAETYTVYIYDSKTGSYKEVCTSETAQAEVTSLNMATEYKFCVSAGGTKNETVYISELSEPIKVTTKYSVPKGFNLSSIKSSAYKLSWNKISKAESYNIYKSQGGSFELYDNVKGNSFSETGLSYGTINTYKISAVYKVKSKTVESELSDVVRCSTLPAKVKNLKVTPYTQSAQLVWDAVSNATHYEIFIYEDGEYVLQATAKEASYKLTGLSEGTSYKFGVRAVIKLEAGTANGSRAAVSAYTKPAKVKTISLSSVTASKQKISWPAAVGANYYYVYRYSSKAGAYIQVAATSSRSYTFSSLSSGTTYSYRVYSAVVKEGKELVRGDKSSTFKFSTDPAKVKNLKSTSVTSSKVALSWDSVKSATTYEVSYYSAELGSYVLAGFTEKNSFTVKGLSAKTGYKFKVRAIRTLNSKDYTGSYSSVITVKTK